MNSINVTSTTFNFHCNTFPTLILVRPMIIQFLKITTKTYVIPLFKVFLSDHHSIRLPYTKSTIILIIQARSSTMYLQRSKGQHNRTTITSHNPKENTYSLKTTCRTFTIRFIRARTHRTQQVKLSEICLRRSNRESDQRVNKPPKWARSGWLFMRTTPRERVLESLKSAEA